MSVEEGARAQYAMRIARGIGDVDVRAVRSVYGSYLELPLEFDARYEAALGEVRVEITAFGRQALTP